MGAALRSVARLVASGVMGIREKIFFPDIQIPNTQSLIFGKKQ
jgi:hypothetical protein